MKHTGFSLVEILISLFLSALLLGTMTQHYLTVKRQFIAQATGIHQEMDLMMILDLLSLGVKRAGFTPCAPIEQLITPKSQELKGINYQNKRLTISALSPNYTIQPKVFTDKSHFSVKHAFYTKETRLLIADCFHAETARIKAIQGKKIYLTQALIYDYIPPIYIGSWTIEHFYTAKNTEGKNALFYQTEHHSDELTDAVKAVQCTISKNQVNISFLLKHGATIMQQIRRRNI